MRLLFIIFVVVPIVEILLLLEVSDRIGGLNTVLAVVLTAFIGINMLKHQGISTLFRAKQRMSNGQIPAQEIIEGLFLAFGGALLLTPGFITDAVGFMCLIGPSRRLMARYLISDGRWSRMFPGQVFFHGPSAGRANHPKSDIFEGEFTRDGANEDKLEHKKNP